MLRVCSRVDGSGQDVWTLVVKVAEVEAANFHGSGWLRHCESKQGSARRDIPCTMATARLGRCDQHHGPRRRCQGRGLSSHAQMLHLSSTAPLPSSVVVFPAEALELLTIADTKIIFLASQSDDPDAFSHSAPAHVDPVCWRLAMYCVRLDDFNTRRHNRVNLEVLAQCHCCTTIHTIRLYTTI